MIRKRLKYTEYPFSNWGFILPFCIFTVLTFLSLFNTFLMEEGTIEKQSLVDQLITDSFPIWKFPFHYLLEPMMEFIPFLGIFFLPLFALNIVFYSIISERITALLTCFFRKLQES